MSNSHVFTLNIDCGNAAFDDGPWDEIARILRETADRVELQRDQCRWFQTIRDINGNDVGRFALKHSDYRG